jgi:hypothetical protein
VGVGVHLGQVLFGDEGLEGDGGLFLPVSQSHEVGLKALDQEIHHRGFMSEVANQTGPLRLLIPVAQELTKGDLPVVLPDGRPIPV